MGRGTALRWRGMRNLHIYILTNLLIVAALTHVTHTFGRERLTPYLADSATNTGIAVIVCPGGSYSWLDMGDEGSLACEWLRQNGINAYLLRYRVASVPAYIFGFRVLGIGHKWPDMLYDVQDALRYVYDHAAEHHVDTARIGVMGFSAGGHLALSSYAYSSPNKGRQGRVLPSFLVPIYPVVTFSDNASLSDSLSIVHCPLSISRPLVHKRSRRGALGVWNQWNETLRDSLSIERHIRPDCPPVFLVACEDDHVVDFRNSLLLDSALTANNVPHTFYRCQTGGHGFGVSDTKGSPESRAWRTAFLAWLRQLFNY